VGGAARFQRVNVLAAIATAYVQGMRYDDIRAGCCRSSRRRR
jgi:UDP-N-acetylmuramyl tripeptide synthase